MIIRLVGSVHDKRIVGARSEGEILLRPHRRSDAAYKADKDGAKAFNQALSKIRVKVEHVFAQMKHFRVLSNHMIAHCAHWGLGDLAARLILCSRSIRPAARS